MCASVCVCMFVARLSMFASKFFAKTPGTSVCRFPDAHTLYFKCTYYIICIHSGGVTRMPLNGAPDWRRAKSMCSGVCRRCRCISITLSINSVASCNGFGPNFELNLGGFWMKYVDEFRVVGRCAILVNKLFIAIYAWIEGEIGILKMF